MIVYYLCRDMSVRHYCGMCDNLVHFPIIVDQETGITEEALEEAEALGWNAAAVCFRGS